MKTLPGSILFFGSVCFAYVLLFIFIPEKALKAVETSGRLLFNILLPMGFVFLILFGMNLFVKSPQVARIFGKRSGFKGVVLATAAGILSTGPIYAWYPLLSEMKERGADNRLLAIFLNSRVVKPFLWPVMIAYFDLNYVLVLNFFMIAGSLVSGYLLYAWVKDD